MTGQAKRLSIRALAAELGTSKSHLGRHVKADWWPRDDDGQPTRDVKKARAAIAANVGAHAQDQAAAPGTTSATSPPASRTPPPSEVLLALRDQGGDDLARAEAMAKAAAWSLAEGLESGVLQAKDYDNAKKAVDSLRAAQKDAVAHARAIGDLIYRADAIGALGDGVRRLVGILDGLESLLIPQVEVWLSDPRFTGLSTTQRAAQVRGWYAAKVREFRELVADELLVEAEAA